MVDSNKNSLKIILLYYASKDVYEMKNKQRLEKIRRSMRISATTLATHQFAEYKSDNDGKHVDGGMKFFSSDFTDGKIY
jgi:hypothetical protein